MSNYDSEKIKYEDLLSNEVVLHKISKKGFPENKGNFGRLLVHVLWMDRLASGVANIDDILVEANEGFTGQIFYGNNPGAGSRPKKEDKSITAVEFLKLTRGYVRSNYDKITQRALETALDVAGVGINERFDKMDQKQFTDYFKGRGGGGLLWASLNSNPGYLWMKSVTPKERAFITWEAWAYEGINHAPIKSRLTYHYHKPYQYSQRDSKHSIQTSSTLFIGPQKRGGKEILVKKVFLDKQIFLASVDNIVEQGQVKVTGNDYQEEKKLTVEDYNKLIEAGDDDDAGYSAFNLFANVQVIPQWVKQWIDDLLGSTYDSDYSTVLNFKKSAATKLGIPGLTLDQLKKELAEKDLGFTLNQCLISAKLSEIGQFRKNIRRLRYTQAGKSSAPYGRRIYCADSSVQNLYMNYLTVPKGFQELITETTDTDFTKNYRYKFKLGRVEELKNGQSRTYDYLFESATGKSKLKEVKLVNSYNQNSVARTVFGKDQDNTSFGAEEIKIDKVDISIKGETIATVKSNIDVKIQFSLASIEVINAIFEADDPYGKKVKGQPAPKYQFSLLELLTQQAGKEYKGTQSSRALKTAYVPTKNRLIMQIVPELKPGGTLDGNAKDYFDGKSPIIYDLALLKYDLKKDSVKQSCTLTVHYKGYLKSFLNSPICDMLQEPGTKQQAFDLEEKTISELESDSKYCKIKEVRKKLSKHFSDMERIAKTDKKYDFILQPLIDRGMLFEMEVNNIETVLNGNIDAETKKIISPAILRDAINIKNIKQSDSTGGSPKLQIDKPQKIPFFFFGDLVDVLLDALYGKAKFKGTDVLQFTFNQIMGINTTSAGAAAGGANPGGGGGSGASGGVKKAMGGGAKTAVKEAGAQAQQPNIYEFPIRDSASPYNFNTNADVVDEKGETKSLSLTDINNKFKNFMLKVILPTFNPIDYDSASGTYTTKDNVEISIADVPVALGYFNYWFQKEIIDRETQMYPIGGMINNILNALVNNILADKCYRASAIERKYFAVATDFSLFNPTDKASNRAAKVAGRTAFDRIRQSLAGNYTGVIKIDESNSPIIKKDINIERNDHCNFLIVNELVNSFKSFEGLELGGGEKKKNAVLRKQRIPSFMTERIVGSDSDAVVSGFVESIDFSKTNLPMGEEIRFSKEGLNELHMLSAVHDAKIKCNPVFHLYPGQVVWVDAGFIEGTEIYGSIPWVAGIGGFQIVLGVSHSFDVEKGLITPSSAASTIDCKFVSAGATALSIQKAAAACTKKANSYKEKQPEPGK